MISDVHLTPAPDGSGLLGYVSCRLGPLHLDGLALRRTRDGRLTLSFPFRTGRRGRRHHFLRPVCDAARREIETAVLAELGLLEDAT